MLRQLGIAVLFVCLGADSTSLAQNLLNEPNAASYDEANDRYLVTSAANASVIAIDNQGSQSYFVTGLGRYVFGNLISGDTLYVGDEYGSTSAFDLNSGSLLWRQYIADAHYTGGMAMDSAGYLYITDGKIYKMNPSDQTYETFVASGLPAYTSKMIYDEPNNRLLTVGYEMFSPITAVDLDDASLTPLAYPPGFNMNGIAMDSERRVYVANYHEGAIYMYDPDFSGPPVLVSDGHGSPSGINYDRVHNLLIVPNFAYNTVDFLSLDDTDGDGAIDLIDNCPEVYNEGQEDADLDDIGDACDECTDTDGDGYGNPGFPANSCAPDNCPEDWNADQFDLDHDNVGDECDNCLWTYNPDQEDLNENDIGDACEGCCQGRVGDANNSGEDEPTISDVSVMIDAKFISGTCEGVIDCFEECDINQSGGQWPTCDDITISDISVLIDYLFITGQTLGLPECL